MPELRRGSAFEHEPADVLERPVLAFADAVLDQLLAQQLGRLQLLDVAVRVAELRPRSTHQGIIGGLVQTIPRAFKPDSPARTRSGKLLHQPLD
jgi:hypothetical protein